jgi:putative (di)nucleoside polyphosphate hydrolase
MNPPRIDKSTLPYRPCVGIMLANRDGHVFVGRRLDQSHGEPDAWQMPQGGVDPGEDQETAAIRELGEETGLSPAHVDIIARSAEEHAYDLPEELIGKLWGGKYRGQSQRWFLMRFKGEDSDVDLHTHHQEFVAWQWVEAGVLVDLIVPFKRALYRKIVEEFSPLL